MNLALSKREFLTLQVKSYSTTQAQICKLSIYKDAAMLQWSSFRKTSYFSHRSTQESLKTKSFASKTSLECLLNMNGKSLRNISARLYLSPWKPSCSQIKFKKYLLRSLLSRKSTTKSLFHFMLRTCSIMPKTRLAILTPALAWTCTHQSTKKGLSQSKRAFRLLAQAMTARFKYRLNNLISVR